MNEPATRHLILTDGRNLSYSDTGSGNNGTWIHCHGIPGSRNELMHLTDDLGKAGIRVIVPDRPGYGESAPHPDFGFASHGDDLRQLADHLQLDQFALSGFSGGGVFAMAAAHDLGDRVTRLTIAATPAVPLMDDPYAHASELTAETWRAALESREQLAQALEALTDSPEALAVALLDAVGEDERRYLTSQPVYLGFYTSLRAALAQGPATAAGALALDSQLIARDLPFRPGAIHTRIQVLHGERDKLVHPEHQEALIGHLPGPDSHRIAGAGHYGALPFLWR